MQRTMLEATPTMTTLATATTSTSTMQTTMLEAPAMVTNAENDVRSYNTGYCDNLGTLTQCRQRCEKHKR